MFVALQTRGTLDIFVHVHHLEKKLRLSIAEIMLSKYAVNLFLK